MQLPGCEKNGYNRYPDEKGTESARGGSNRTVIGKVTTVTPMKRGLKDTRSGPSAEAYRVVTTVTPMKRGLKVRTADGHNSASICYNRYPDEKGTESLQCLSIEMTAPGYNRYPDEKGTESRDDDPELVKTAELQPLPR